MARATPCRTAPRRALAVVAALGCAMLAACAIRYDGAGVTRIGIGLWGLGDPPGVDWNLDWPRREPPELPRSAPAELPPRVPARPEAPFAHERGIGGGRDAAIDDNRDRVPHRALRSPSVAVADGARAGGVTGR